MTKNILISGAGVAGPALAYWLRRFGFNPTVVERAPALREGGSPVDFRGPVHLGVLRKMDLLGEIRKRRTHPRPWAFIDGNGKPKAKLPTDFAGGEVEIRRGDLSHILHEATRDGAEYIFGNWITSLEERPDGVRVTFADGASRMFDLVVGADGMHSGVRSLIFGEESAFSRHSGAYFASYTHDPSWDLLENVEVYNEPGLMVAAGLLVFRPGRELRYDRHDMTEQKRIVAEAYAGAGWRTSEIIADMQAAPDLYLDSISMMRLESFSKGRVTLLGDAAYGATLGGMGTGLAVVGSYVLAGELAAAGGNHRVAFASYEEQVRPYAKGCQGIGAGRFLAPATKGQIWQRNVLARMMTRGPMSKMIGRMDMKAATAISLKDYKESPAMRTRNMAT
jgi:2-polyprenyl-6-methoxyphenol hydroxylase-like FAD-dependent oxidoreductase